MTPSALAWLLRTHDATYPTGGYAQSWGLEPLVQGGQVRDADGFRAFLELLAIPSLLRVDLPFYAAACAALDAADPWPLLGDLARLHHASRTPQPLRQAAVRTGRQRLQMTALVVSGGWCAGALARWEGEGIPPAVPVAAALESRDGSVPREQGAAAYGYAALAGQVAAAGKLLRLGQRAMQEQLQAALVRFVPGIPDALATPVTEAGWTVPFWDIPCARHETAEARLFLS